MAQQSEGEAVKLMVMVVGDYGVGKSALTLRYVTDCFVEDLDPTISDLYPKQVQVDGATYKVNIFDTVPDECISVVDQSARTASGFLYVYSITSRRSFEELYHVRDTVRRSREYVNADLDVPVVLVGCKCDLEGQREVTTAEGLAMAKEFGCEHVEASAKEDVNIERSFITLVRAIHQKRTTIKTGDGGNQGGGLGCTLF